MSQRPSRSDPLSTNLLGLTLERSSAPGVLDGLRSAGLSFQDGAATVVVELPAGWSVSSDGEADIELFILRGDVLLNGSTGGSGTYIRLPPGGVGSRLGSAHGALVIAFWNVQRGTERSTEPRMIRSSGVPWRSAGASAGGIFSKSLRLPDQSSDSEDGCAGGYLRLILQTPGNADIQQHAHRQCWEEVITLAGDVLMADEALTGPGSVLGHPRDFWHGPFASHSGAVLLVHTDAPMESPWPRKHYPGGDSLVEGYLNSCPWMTAPKHTGWDGYLAGLPTVQ